MAYGVTFSVALVVLSGSFHAYVYEPLPPVTLAVILAMLPLQTEVPPVNEIDGLVFTTTSTGPAVAVQPLRVTSTE